MSAKGSISGIANTFQVENDEAQEQLDEIERLRYLICIKTGEDIRYFNSIATEAGQIEEIETLRGLIAGKKITSC